MQCDRHSVRLYSMGCKIDGPEQFLGLDSKDISGGRQPGAVESHYCAILHEERIRTTDFE
jgi:hypothetical protein